LGIDSRKYLTDYFIEYTDPSNPQIYMTITDHPGARVGIRVKNGGRVGILGTESNTFTGDVFILDHSTMSLRKGNGAIAVKSNIFVRNGSKLILDAGNQIAVSPTPRR